MNRVYLPYNLTLSSPELCEVFRKDLQNGGFRRSMQLEITNCDRLPSTIVDGKLRITLKDKIEPKEESNFKIVSPWIHLKTIPLDDNRTMITVDSKMVRLPIQIESYPEIKCSTFDKNLAKKLKHINWEDQLSIQMLETHIQEFVQKRVDSYFQFNHSQIFKAPCHLSKHTRIVKDEELNFLIRNIWDDFQDTGILMDLLKVNLIKIDDILKIYISSMHKCTRWSQELFNYIDRLIRANTIHKFLNLLENPNSNISKWGLRCLAKNKKTAITIKDFLRNINCQKIENIIRLRWTQHQRIQHILEHRFFWEIQPDHREALNEISVSDVMRSLYTDYPIYETIIINNVELPAVRDKVLFIENIFKELGSYQDYNVMAKLLIEFEKFHWPQGSPQDYPINLTADLVSNLMKLILSSYPNGGVDQELPRISIKNKKSWDNVFADAYIPQIQVLRLMTINCWGYADSLIRDLWPKLIKMPYWIRVQVGMRCYVTFRSLQDYQVTQEKAYGIYKREDEKSSYVKDLLGVITFKWNIQFLQSQYIMYLKISEIQFTPSIDATEKWNILTILANP